MSNFSNSTIPSPNSCALCGVEKHHHGMNSIRGTKLHYYVMPTDAQRLERMKQRRAAR